jgi:hypothetical protein
MTVTLLRGKRYSVLFRLSGYKNPRICVAQFLGTDDRGQYVFNFRPLAGTSQIHPDQILGATPTDGPISLPRPVNHVPDSAAKCRGCTNGVCYAHVAEFMQADGRVRICRCPDPSGHHGKRKPR